MITIKAPQRISDNFGQGHFGAPRGNRTHNGIDFNCCTGSAVLAPASGKITKIGYPYGDDLSFRYVQIETTEELNVRVFYISPSVKVGDIVLKERSEIGISQELGKRYSGISEHVHLEVKDAQGNYLNPADVL